MEDPCVKINLIKEERGITLIEMLVSITIVAIVTVMAAPSLLELNDASNNGSLQFLGYAKNVKARAMSTTSAVTVTPTSSRTLVATSGTSCNDSTQSSESRLNFTLPKGANFTNSNWSFCFNQYGLTDNNFTINIQDKDSVEEIEIMLGGAVVIND